MNEKEIILRRALRLAARGRYRTSPNPLVGCVILRDGVEVGWGYHRQVGGPHAEVEALRRAGDQARGSTVYVTLEPCAHHGRTPPCAEGLVAAGVARVIACHRDPNPRVSGGGFARLRAAGIEVESGFLVEEAVRLNWQFLVAMTLNRPAVTLKWAMSLDGKIATVTGQSQWISSPEARRWALGLREEHDAILVGIETALADDPRLDRRLGKARGANVRVVLDRRLRLSPEAKLFDLPGDILVYTQNDDLRRRQDLEKRGGIVECLPKVEPQAVLKNLYQRGVRSLLVEGGGTITEAFVKANLFDRVAVDCAPILIAGEAAPGPVRGSGFAVLGEAPRLERLRVERRGGDVIMQGFRSGCLQGLSNSVVD